MPDGLSRGRPILLTADAVGGVWRYALTLADGLARRGAPAVLAAMGPAPSPAQRAECAGVPGLRLLETGLPLDWTAAAPSDVLHAANALATLAGAVGAGSVHLHAPALVGDARWPVPVVAVAHSCVGTWWEAARSGPLPDDLAWRAAQTGRGLRTANAVIAPTAAHAAALARVYGPVGGHVVHNGGTPAPGRAERTRHVLTAGRLWDENKNAAALDAAAATLGVPVRAAGPVQGPNGAAIRLQHIVGLGPLDATAIADEYAAATVFVSLARYEPFGLAVLEAAQAGCVLVLSDIPTFRELWNGAALFVPPGADPVPALREALDRPDLAAAAFARSARYTADATVDGTLAVHRALVAA